MNILLCCGGGFSSSAIATRIQKEIEERGMQAEHAITFFPFGMIKEETAQEKLNQYDIAIMCPHLVMAVKLLIQSRAEIRIPIYILPPRIYGNMQLDVILKDCEDIIKRYEAGASNPVQFPGEEQLMKVRRVKAYRDVQK